MLLCLQLTGSVTPGFVLGPGRIRLKACVNGGAPFSFTTGHAQTQWASNNCSTAAHLGERRGGIQLWIFSSSSAKHSVCYEADEQPGRQSTTAHFESLQEHFSPKDHPKSVCFSWKMPLKLWHPLSECLKHYMVDNWNTKPFLVTNIFQIRSVLNSGL